VRGVAGDERRARLAEGGRGAPDAARRRRAHFGPQCGVTSTASAAAAATASGTQSSP
jgi:hypothetical protein